VTGAAAYCRAKAVEQLERLILLGPAARRAMLLSMPRPALRAIYEEWYWQAHGGQQEPESAACGRPWRVWTIVAGRGFGKTRAGAEWVWGRSRENPRARIALVAATEEEAVRVMVEGESGILAFARGDEEPRWIASRKLLVFPSGAEAQVFSAERPEKLRGPQHHFAWCDELAKWSRADATWNNLLLGLRLGEKPRTVVTTTPRPVPLLRRILAMPRCAQTHGRTDENIHLPRDFLAAMDAMFAGTRLARQELFGELLEDFEGALWTRELLENARGAAIDPLSRLGRGSLSRVVLGLDPPASTGGDSCGIVVCGKDGDGVAWVLADLTAQGLSPEAWARRVAEAVELYGVGRIVAEKNQGGDMIASVLRGVDAALPVQLVAATRSKAARAEPIALRFETGIARLAGHFPELEDQLCALTWSGYQGAGSPDRADAMVWAMTELFEKEQAAPRVRVL
jgi:phage terminase large subunit-like protein